MPMNDDHARFMDLGFEPRRSPPAPKRTFESRRRPGRSARSPSDETDETPPTKREPGGGGAGALVTVGAAALKRSPSPRKTPHKFRGSTIYPPAPTTRVEVPVPTSPGF